MKIFFLRLLGFGLLLTGALAAWGAENPTQLVLLRDSADLSHDVIQLVDLLPAGVPIDLRQACANVKLGRAPQPGTLRILDRDQVLRKLAAWPTLLRRLQVPSHITVQRSGNPIRREIVSQTISSFLRKQSWKESELPNVATLHWSGGVATRDEDPALEVTGMSGDGRQQVLEVRLRCLDRSLCGSFVVEAPAVLSDMARDKDFTSPTSVPRERQFATESRSRSPTGPPMTLAGRRANLILEDNALRISLPVVCLERGALGQQIRVRAVSGHHIFVAKVMSSSQVYATF